MESISLTKNTPLPEAEYFSIIPVLWPERPQQIMKLYA
jgi:hypothetical protein